MELRVPVDVVILRTLSDGEPANPVRVRWLIDRDHDTHLADNWDIDDVWSLEYVSQRLSELRRDELVERVPPDDSGLYRINDIGYAALMEYLDTGSREISFKRIADRADDVTIDALPASVLDDADHDAASS